MRIFIALGLLVLLLVGCSGIDQKKAEWTAKNFVNERVKFFSKEESEQKNLTGYNMSSITSYREGSLWAVVIHVESAVNNKTIDNDLIVKVNRKGKVVEFNGRKLD